MRSFAGALLCIILIAEVSSHNVELSYLMNSKWSQWSPWSFCSNSVRVRVRACSTVRGFRCVGHNKEFESCKDVSKLKETTDYDNLDPWNDDRKIAMSQLYQDYESGVPDIRPSVKPPSMRTRPAGTAPPQITKKTNILESMPRAIKGVVNLMEISPTESQPPATSHSTSLMTTTTEIIPPNGNRLEAIDRKAPEVPNEDLSTLPKKSFTFAQSPAKKANELSGKVSLISEATTRDPLPESPSRKESMRSSTILPTIPSSMDTIILEQAPNETSVKPSSTPATITDITTTSLLMETTRGVTHSSGNALSMRRREDKLAEFKDLTSEVATSSTEFGGRSFEFGLSANRKKEPTTTFNTQKIATTSSNIVIVAPRHPAARPKSLRERVSSSNLATISYSEPLSTRTKEADKIEDYGRTAAAAPPTERNSKFRMTALNENGIQEKPKLRRMHTHVNHHLSTGRRNSEEKKTSVADITVKTINNTIATIGKIINKLELEAKSLVHSTGESAEHVDLSKNPTEKKVFLETKALDGRIKIVQDNLEHEFHELRHHHSHVAPQNGVLEGDTARALSWMIANMTKELGEEGNLPVVDVIPLVRVTTPKSVSSNISSILHEGSVHQAKPKQPFIEVVEPALQNAASIIQREEGKESERPIGDSTFLAAEVAPPVLERESEISMMDDQPVQPERNLPNPVWVNAMGTIESAASHPAAKGSIDSQETFAESLNENDSQMPWKWSEWSEWSECNCKSQIRKRVCVTIGTIGKRKEIVPIWKRNTINRQKRSEDLVTCPGPQHHSQPCESKSCHVLSFSKLLALA